MFSEKKAYQEIERPSKMERRRLGRSPSPPPSYRSRNCYYSRTTETSHIREQRSRNPSRSCCRTTFYQPRSLFYPKSRNYYNHDVDDYHRRQRQIPSGSGYDYNDDYRYDDRPNFSYNSDYHEPSTSNFYSYNHRHDDDEYHLRLRRSYRPPSPSDGWRRHQPRYSFNSSPSRSKPSRNGSNRHCDGIDWSDEKSRSSPRYDLGWNYQRWQSSRNRRRAHQYYGSSVPLKSDNFSHDYNHQRGRRRSYGGRDVAAAVTTTNLQPPSSDNIAISPSPNPCPNICNNSPSIPPNSSPDPDYISSALSSPCYDPNSPRSCTPVLEHTPAASPFPYFQGLQ
ncbi:OLC1v1021724C1 [Oldenlandia corymbosa var. corymbosa]|uniref:OLC1v1021724C1 n=1 Tax=Oldenlandia corymbosa var. corymbosa TaxID=529605 RepID=A0AAV1BYS3_OLDCO|nr:OLC1v1021724C1 [Oldenlandia corymbosa var. corymbosa]